MTFAVQAESYDRFLGRYSTLPTPKLAELAGVSADPLRPLAQPPESRTG